MLSDLIAILWAPFLMCLVLTGIHAYLGVHVLAREVVFVDIAIAQIAALGATVAFLQGHDVDAWESYAYSLAATLVGALVLAITRSRRRNVSQEAVIGIVYAVSSAAAVLVADRAPHGAEQVRTMLVGNLLAVRPFEVAKVFALYSLVGLMHWQTQSWTGFIVYLGVTLLASGFKVRFRARVLDWCGVSSVWMCRAISCATSASSPSTSLSCRSYSSAHRCRSVDAGYQSRSRTPHSGDLRSERCSAACTAVPRTCVPMDTRRGTAADLARQAR